MKGSRQHLRFPVLGTVGSKLYAQPAPNVGERCGFVKVCVLFCVSDFTDPTLYGIGDYVKYFVPRRLVPDLPNLGSRFDGSVCNVLVDTVSAQACRMGYDGFTVGDRVVADSF